MRKTNLRRMKEPFKLLVALLLILLAAAFLIWLLPDPAQSRNLGQYAQMPQELRDWFNKLENRKKERCCADADGYDAQWDTQGGKYRVFSSDGWIVVPDEAVVDAPNISHVAKVWWTFDDASRVTNRGRKVRCFMPGLEG